MNTNILHSLSFTLLSLMPLNMSAQNPYLPMWEYIPDGEPYVFADPDNPGKKRVYIYGSHDTLIDGYCGRELVAWSASTDSLSRWRYDGIILEVRQNAKGEYLDSEHRSDVFYAPDIVEKTESDGRKMYYLYPNNQCGGRNGMVAASERPDGPFRVINWSETNDMETVGDLGFDPAVFIDDDGRVYGYWGFEEPCVAELDPTTMATVKAGTEVRRNYINGYKKEGIFRFFEASSIRKIKDKYVLVYSRFTGEGEFGLPSSNYTLAYAYSNSPMGPFVYGGTIIDGRGRGLDEHSRPIPTATPDGNTHGSICEINGRWWVFYHRQTGLDEYSRQAMVAPITVEVTEGKDGMVRISEGEYTSEGFMTDGLNPFRRHSAGIACYYTATKPAVHKWPRNTFYGSYVKPMRLKKPPLGDVYRLDVNHNPVVNNTDGSVVGYKYFNLSVTNGVDNLCMSMTVVPEGIDGTIDIYVNSPHLSCGGKKVGSLPIRRTMPHKRQTLTAPIQGIRDMSGKHALFFVIKADVKGKSVCEIHDFAMTVIPG